jgi:thiamine pyrophosphate-dependent acetolactate synthase large subunit-like protein
MTGGTSWRGDYAALTERIDMTTNGELNVGEATIKLLEKYGVDTLFGIPGVHTLDFCRGLNMSSIRHVQARNEQGAGFMADGYARASGKPGVALVISGPGVTNALTAVGQAYADSIPLLMLSSDAASYTIGKGWGCLHEVPSLTDTTAPLTAFSATAMSPEEVPGLIARAFSVFASERPRPVHIAIPIDILAMPAGGDWEAIELPRACELLRNAKQPMICVGGGAWLASEAITELAERLGAAVIGSTAGKGIIDDSHPLSLSAGTVRGETLEINGKIIRVDLDPRKMNDLYPAAVAIIGGAKTTTEAIARQLGEVEARTETAAEVAAIRSEILANLSDSEVRHCKTLKGAAGRYRGDGRYMPAGLYRRVCLRRRQTQAVALPGRLLHARLRPARRHRRQAGAARYAGGLLCRRRRLHVYRAGTGDRGRARTAVAADPVE